MPRSLLSKRWYTVSDLVAMGYGAETTIFRQIKSGEIPATKSGQRYLIPIDEFEALLESKRVVNREGVAG